MPKWEMCYVRLKRDDPVKEVYVVDVVHYTPDGTNLQTAGKGLYDAMEKEFAAACARLALKGWEPHSQDESTCYFKRPIP